METEEDDVKAWICAHTDRQTHDLFLTRGPIKHTSEWMSEREWPRLFQLTNVLSHCDDMKILMIIMTEWVVKRRLKEWPTMFQIVSLINWNYIDLIRWNFESETHHSIKYVSHQINRDRIWSLVITHNSDRSCRDTMKTGNYEIVWYLSRWSVC